jgi:preprotein translocase subunit SecG
MRILLNCIHVLAALVMIVVVLLQQGKGADIGAAFGAGSSQTLFGSRGAGNFLTKLTTAFVVIFMGTSISLSYLTAPRSVLDELDLPTAEAPATEPLTDETAPGEAPSGFEAVPAPEGDKPAAESGTPAPAAEPSTAPAEAPTAPSTTDPNAAAPAPSDSTGR